MKSLILRYVTGSVVLLALWDAGSRALGPEILPDPLLRCLWAIPVFWGTSA